MPKVIVLDIIGMYKFVKTPIPCNFMPIILSGFHSDSVRFSLIGLV